MMVLEAPGLYGPVLAAANDIPNRGTNSQNLPSDS